MPDPLIMAFQQALPAERRADADDPQVSLALEDAVALARTAHPAIDIDAELMAGHLARCAAAQPGPLDATLARLPAADLYLALACSMGHPAALASLEDGPLREVDATASRLRLPESLRDEGKQVVRTALLVASDGGPPAIAGYAGRGDLRGWLRVVATRELLRLARRGRREVTLEETLLDAALPGVDPGLERLKEAYRVELGAALRQAFAALAREQRTLLRLAVADGLSIDELGTLYGVHRATAARRLARARDQLGRLAEKAVADRLGIPREDVPSVIRLVQSRLQLSLERTMGGSRAGSTPPAGSSQGDGG